MSESIDKIKALDNKLLLENYNIHTSTIDIENYLKNQKKLTKINGNDDFRKINTITLKVYYDSFIKKDGNVFIYFLMPKSLYSKIDFFQHEISFTKTQNNDDYLVDSVKTDHMFSYLNTYYRIEIKINNGKKSLDNFNSLNFIQFVNNNYNFYTTIPSASSDYFTQFFKLEFLNKPFSFSRDNLSIENNCSSCYQSSSSVRGTK